MSKLSFELTRTDVKSKGNYFLLIQLDETEFPSKLTKTQKFRTEIDYSTQFPVFHQNFYSFNKVNLGNKLILRIGLFRVKNPDKLKRKIKIEEKKKVNNNETKQIKNDINPKVLFSESELIGNVEISLDSVWIENLRKCKEAIYLENNDTYECVFCYLLPSFLQPRFAGRKSGGSLSRLSIMSMLFDNIGQMSQCSHSNDTSCLTP